MTPASSQARPSTAPPSVIEGFQLSGKSDLPDPETHAYRADLADTALAGRVIASHYADPMPRKLCQSADLLSSDEDGAECLVSLEKGEVMRLLDIGRGWAWGYGPDGRVGYVPAKAVCL